MNMQTVALATEFAPAERAYPELLEEQARQLLEEDLLPTLFNAVSQLVVVLNESRQIVFANRAFLDLLGAPDLAALKGKRPGEALKCVHAAENASGCGTTRFCRQCGAVGAILASQGGQVSARDCRISREGGDEALDLAVQAAPLVMGEHRYTVFSVSDTSGQKRREVLERMFFHDILNTATGVKGLAQVFGMARSNQQELFRQRIVTGASRLVDEIVSQRTLAAAETGELVCSPSSLESLQFLEELCGLYREHDVARDRELVVAEDSEAIAMYVDPGLISRVLGNMLKNALEASAPGEIVTAGCKRDGRGVLFSVNNPSVMPPDVQLQIFQRSFSTKGKGRGVGTYSMKLLAERYLSGKLAFTSSLGKGTTFTVWIPV